ncbi:MAG: iron ABC transporter permease [Ectothiorhodospiraceae bacterium]|nr:iron ABC transporter permease [Ectothiorhodospiraceae bacterium]
MTTELAPTGARAGPRVRRATGEAFDAWGIATIAVAALVAMPVVVVPLLALFPSESIWAHLASTVLPGYVTTTVELMLGVACGTLAMGVGAAWLVTMCRFPGRRIFEWALLLPLAVPAYVIAYVYTDLLEYAGPVQGALRAAFGWRSAADYHFPEIRSLEGAVLMLSLVLYPYVYMLARAAFLEQSVNILDAARSLGCGPWGAFLRVSLPMARPGIVVGLSLAMMETLNDYGTVSFFAVRTLTAGLYDVWLNMGNLGGAAQIATVMLAFVAVLVVLERGSRRRRRHYQGGDRMARLPGYRLRGWRCWLAVFLCTFPFVAGFLVPALVLANHAVAELPGGWTPQFRGYALNSLGLSAAAAVAAVCASLLVSYRRRLRPNAWLTLATRVAGLGYAVPGAVLAIGVLVPLAAFDNALDALAREWLGMSTGLLLSGTVVALLLAYVVRFLAVSMGAVEASLARVTPSMDMASRTLGHGPGATFRRVHLPLVRGGVLTAALVVFVDSMKELPATLILRPFDFDTLATHVYQFASDEQIERASLGALLIVLAGLAPVIVLSRTIAATRALEEHAGTVQAPAPAVIESVRA